MCSRLRSAFGVGLLTVGMGASLGAGCDQWETWLTQQAATGTLRVIVTDKPFPVEFLQEATVTVTRVDVRQAESGTVSAGAPDGADAGSNDASPFVTIFDGEKTLNLLDLRNGRVDLLAESSVPAGSYDQMRLVVTDGRVVLTDGREFDLKVPSGEQSGIKLNFNFEVASGLDGGSATELLLDVDLSRAFRVIPGGPAPERVSHIHGFHFQPSVAMRLIDVAGSGDVTGLVVDGGFNFLDSVVVTAYAGDADVTSTVTDPDGTFMLLGLPPGLYRLEFSRPMFLDVTLDDVYVYAGEATDVGLVLMLGVE